MKRWILIFLLAVAACEASTTYWFDSTPWTTYGDFNTSPVYTTTDSGHTATMLQYGQSIRFASNSANVSIYSSQEFARTYVLIQDGTTDVASFTTPSGSSTFGTWSIATGLDTGSVHEYELMIVTPFRISADRWYEGALILDTNSLATVVHAARPFACRFGDSITAMSNNPPGLTDIRAGDFWQAFHAAGYQTVMSGAPGDKASDLAAITSNVPANSSIVAIEAGINDIAQNTGQSTFTTAYTSLVNNIVTQIGAGKKIVCLQPFPGTSWSEGSRNTYGGYIQTAIAGISNVTYVSTIGWMPSTNSYTPDGTHPNALGYSLLANRQIPIFAAAAVVITGPAGGPDNISSQAFTVTMSNGATFTGDQDITLTASNGTLNATAAGGSISNNNTAAVTVTAASGNTNFTFVYTPTAAGTKTITPSTTQTLWTMPGSASYLSSDAIFNVTTVSGAVHVGP